jgi:hypothetical protein
VSFVFRAGPGQAFFVKRSVKIGVYGMEEAPGFLAGELRAVGLDARELPDLAPRTLAGLDLLHVFYPPMAWRGLVTAKLLGLATVAHWMGSDVLAVRRGRQRIKLRLCLPFVDLHLAVHRPLVDELAMLGVRARHQPNLSAHLRTEELPWPDEPAVLCYTPPTGWGLYGVGRLFELARRLPGVRFYSCGSAEPPVGAPSNWEHLGLLDDMGPAFARARVLVRPTRRDGLARMVLEALGYARRVVWTQPFPHVLFARTDDGLLAQTRRALESGENAGGREMIRAFFDNRRTVYRLCDYYRLLVGRPLE